MAFPFIHNHYLYICMLFHILKLHLCAFVSFSDPLLKTSSSSSSVFRFKMISMRGEYCINQMLQSPSPLFSNKGNDFMAKDRDHGLQHQWMVMEEYDASNSLSESSSSFETLPASTSGSLDSSSSSSDLVDDASSSQLNTNSNNGPLYELSELMAQLPIKRGLSKFFQGKSQSFASLSKVTSVEDLAKKEIIISRRNKMKACKSYGGGLDHTTNKLYTLPKPVIAKKSSRNSVTFVSFQ